MVLFVNNSIANYKNVISIPKYHQSYKIYFKKFFNFKLLYIIPDSDDQLPELPERRT